MTKFGYSENMKKRTLLYIFRYQLEPCKEIWSFKNICLDYFFQNLVIVFPKSHWICDQKIPNSCTYKLLFKNSFQHSIFSRGSFTKTASSLKLLKQTEQKTVSLFPSPSLPPPSQKPGTSGSLVLKGVLGPNWSKAFGYIYIYICILFIYLF